MKRRAVFLDRDGVLNCAVVRESVVEALRRLKEAGFVLVVVSNQPDVANGTTPKVTVEAINAYLAERLPIDRFIMCYHDDGDNCDCRKPRSGMLLAGARELDVDLASSYMVGDRWRDVKAGIGAGCKTVFIDYGYDEKQPESFDYRASSLLDAATIILKGGEYKKIEDLRVKIFADGADKSGMLEMYAKPFIKGLTTNPTLMRKVGITDYKAFAKEILAEIKDKPLSFEVLSDDFSDMERQALEIASWGANVYVKIPVTNTKRETCYALARKLASQNVKLNVTALMTLTQVCDVVAVLDPNVPSYVSVFAGRIADTARDPVPLMAAAVEILKVAPAAELIWASPREVLNIFQADEIGCHVITVTNDILNKLVLVGKDLSDYSLDTVKMFYKDALEAGYNL
jgi:transaldolase